MGAKVWIGMALAACAGLALAGGPREVRKQTEASMLVTGTIVIEPDGHVRSYQVDQPEKLPTAATGLIGQGRCRLEIPADRHRRQSGPGTDQTSV